MAHTWGFVCSALTVGDRSGRMSCGSERAIQRGESTNIGSALRRIWTGKRWQSSDRKLATLNLASEFPLVRAAHLQ